MTFVAVAMASSMFAPDAQAGRGCSYLVNPQSGSVLTTPTKAALSSTIEMSAGKAVSFQVVSSKLPTPLFFVVVDSGDPLKWKVFTKENLDTPGDYDVVIEVTVDGCTTSLSYIIRVGAVCPKPISLEPNGRELKPALLGRQYRSEVFNVLGSTGKPYTFAHSGTPPGIGAVPEGDVALLVGTPTQLGKFENATVTVTDSNGCAASATNLLVVDCPTIIPNTVPGAVARNAYSQTLAPTGGTAPYTLTLVSVTPQIPATLTNNVLSFTATTAGTLSVVVSARDSLGCTNNITYNIPVACPVITFNALTTNSGRQGTAFSGTVSANNGSGAYTYAVAAPTTLPPGLSLNSATGVISGTPTTAGTFTFEIEATDSSPAACKGKSTYSIVIEAGCPTFSISLTPATATVKSSYSGSLIVTGGTPGYEYSVDGLPAGLVVDGRTGKITGTPETLGTFTLTVSIADSKGCRGSAKLNLTVSEVACPTLAISPSSLSNATVGKEYVVDFTVANAENPTFQIQGSLPPGLVFDRNRLIGTPKEPGSFSFELKATDAKGCTTPIQRYTLTVNSEACPTILVLPSSVPNGTVGTFYPETPFEAKGSTGPFTWSVSSGSLPPGLILKENVLVGTPTTAGTFSFAIKAGDKLCSGSASYTIVIAPAVQCPTDKAGLTAPANAEKFDGTKPITFSWNAVKDAAGYEVMLSNNGGSTFSIGAAVQQTTFPSVTLSPAAGSWVWFVKTYFEKRECTPSESARQNFSVVPNTTCPTATARPLAPGNGTTSLENVVIFEWVPADKAYKYELEISFDGGREFKGVEITDGTSLKLELPNGTIDWRIESFFENCPSTFSSSFRLNVGKPACPLNPAAPKPVAPANGAQNLASPVTFQWTDVAGESGFSVVGSINGEAVTFGTTGPNVTQLSTSVGRGDVVWTVQALFGDCPFTVSDKFSFTSAGGSCNTTPTTLFAPANNATTDTTVAFEWTEVKGATGYELNLSSNGVDFKPQEITSELGVKKLFLPGTRIFWFVRTYFVGCDPQKSETRSFTVREETKCATGTIKQNAPVGGATVSSPVTFRFSSLPNVKFYRVWTAKPKEPPQLAGVAEPTAASEVSLLAKINTTGVVSWQVEAVFSDCPSILSGFSQFTVLTSLTCGSNTAPVQVSPTRGATTTPAVELRWNPVAGATGYKVWLAYPGQPFADTFVQGTSLTLTDLKAGEYRWYLEAIFEGCTPVKSLEEFTFNVQLTEPRCPTAAPSPIAPAEGTTQGSPVTFVWTSVDEATSYRLFYTVDGELQPTVETNGTSISRPIDPGKVSWIVEAVFEGCKSTRFSRPGSFEVRKATVCATDKPQTLTPRSGVEVPDSDVEFTWSAIGGAISYQVIVLGEDGSPTAYENPDPLSRNQTRLNVRLDPGSYEWWVVAAVSGCDKAVSNRSTFRIPRPPSCDGKPPILLAPANGSRNPTTGVKFSWSKVAGATGYDLNIAVDGIDVPLSPITETSATVSLPAGVAVWKVDALFANCPPVESAEGRIVIATPSAQCVPPSRPKGEVVGQALSGTQYTVRWSAVGVSTVYELQESETPSFANATTTVVNGLSSAFVHTVSGDPKSYYYRVRAVSPCSNDRSAYSDVVRVIVVPPNTIEIQTKGTAEVGVEGGLVQTLFLPGFATPVTFTATSDQEWLTITPSSGTLPTAGLNLTLTSDPGALSVGSNIATVNIEYGTAGKGIGSNATSSKSLPLSVTLVTPVSPGGKNTPPPDSLIIPAVAHAAGANGSQFESDVRIYNSSSKPITYLLNFTPSGVDGTQVGSNTTLQVAAGATTALDDIVASFFGTGSASAAGMVEIRPLTLGTTAAAPTGTVAQLATIASSRTFNKTANGTFGQYVPAVKFSDFVGRAASGETQAILSMQQIANSADYRTNFALIEGSGEPAEVMMRVFNLRGDLLAEIPQTLAPSEMKRLDGLLALNGINLEDGRVEVEVTSTTGKVTSYASRLDNRTNDPLLVSPVEKSRVNNTRYVVPGVAYIDGVAKWRTDLRVFNAAKTPTRAKVTYYPAGNPDAGQFVDIDIAAGEVKALDNVLNTTFGISAPVASGSIVVETQSASGIIASARTYAQASNGTYGLFAPAVTPQEAIGAKERSLYLLQLENSNNFRTNIGLVETTGQDATVEISMTSPDSKVSQKIPAFTLRGNTFIQFPMANFGLTKSVYNARVSVKVTSGNGRVSAYGALVDNVTQDPTYVPAQ